MSFVHIKSWLSLSDQEHTLHMVAMNQEISRFSYDVQGNPVMVYFRRSPDLELWLSLTAAERTKGSIRIIPEGQYRYAFYQDGNWWYHSTKLGDDFAAGPEPKGWLPLESERARDD